MFWWFGISWSVAKFILHAGFNSDLVKYLKCNCWPSSHQIYPRTPNCLFKFCVYVSHCHDKVCPSSKLAKLNKDEWLSSPPVGPLDPELMCKLKKRVLTKRLMLFQVTSSRKKFKYLCLVGLFKVRYFNRTLWGLGFHCQYPDNVIFWYLTLKCVTFYNKSNHTINAVTCQGP